MTSRSTGGWAVLLEQPAAWTVPLTFLTMVTVSLLTPDRVPAHTRAFLARLHAPETLLLDRSSL